MNGCVCVFEINTIRFRIDNPTSWQWFLYDSAAVVLIIFAIRKGNRVVSILTTMFVKCHRFRYVFREFAVLGVL